LDTSYNGGRPCAQGITNVQSEDDSNKGAEKKEATGVDSWGNADLSQLTKIEERRLVAEGRRARLRKKGQKSFFVSKVDQWRRSERKKGISEERIGKIHVKPQKEWIETVSRSTHSVL